MSIHKGSRVLERKFEDDILNNKLKKEINSLEITEDDRKKLKNVIKSIKRKNFVEIINNENLDKNNEILKLIKDANAEKLIDFIKDFWHANKKGTNGYEINKKWERTEKTRQRLIYPKYTIYIQSTDQNGEYSLENIFNHLKNPKRPLYIGESDDVVNINNLEIKEINHELINSSKIDSIIPGVYENCQVVKVPFKLKNDIPDEKGHNLICSIPSGELEEEISCLDAEGENIVFLRSNSEK